MPVVMQMRFAGVSRDQYEAARGLIGWETNVPPGAVYHVSSFDDDGVLHVTDVWETAEDFQAFSETRLAPGLERLGITGEPEVTIRPAHAIFAPGYTVVVPDQRSRARTVTSVVTEAP
jgi:hypothetical protein